MSGELRGERSYAPIQIMQPEKRELATVPIPPVRRGMDSRAPMLQQDVERYVKRRTRLRSEHRSIMDDRSPSSFYVKTYHCAASAICERRACRQSFVILLWSLSYSYAHNTISQVLMDYIVGDPTHETQAVWR